MIDDVVTAHMAAKLQPFGMVVESVGVKDIVLPGEMKAILTQVVQAEKQAQANVIRRREERRPRARCSTPPRSWRTTPWPCA